MEPGSSSDKCNLSNHHSKALKVHLKIKPHSFKMLMLLMFKCSGFEMQEEEEKNVCFSDSSQSIIINHVDAVFALHRRPELL